MFGVVDTVGRGKGKKGEEERRSWRKQSVAGDDGISGALEARLASVSVGGETSGQRATSHGAWAVGCGLWSLACGLWWCMGGAETKEQPGECRGHAAGADGTCLARVSTVEGAWPGKAAVGQRVWEGAHVSQVKQAGGSAT